MPELRFGTAIRTDKGRIRLTLQDFTSMLNACPVIAAVKDENGLEACLNAPCRIVFVLYGSIMDIPEIVARIRAAGKTPLVHLDLVDGLAARESAVDFIRFRTSAEGIISTKSVLIKRAKELGLIAVQRFFLLDSLALTNIAKQVRLNAPDVIEIIPGVMPKVIRFVAERSPLPVIAGGLIHDAEDIQNALGAGAAAISATNVELWKPETLTN